MHKNKDFTRKLKKSLKIIFISFLLLAHTAVV